MSDPLPPQIGAYRVRRLLGQGGMGKVFEVAGPGGRPLALKLVEARAVTRNALERFTREAALLARVRHPNVVRVLDVGAAPEGQYLVTELVEGQELARVVAAAPLEARRAARVVQVLCGAVTAVHAQGILHRDLKPENVILRADDSPVLLDFGLAREAGGEQLTATGTILGTPAYMSPEQARAVSPKQLDARVDVYGLGAILFAALAGHPPVDGSSVVELLTHVLRGDLLWGAIMRPDVPRALVAICRGAMAVDREQRFPTAEQLGLDLLRFTRGEQPIAASGLLEVTPALESQRPPRRRRDPPPGPSLLPPTVDLPRA